MIVGGTSRAKASWFKRMSAYLDMDAYLLQSSLRMWLLVCTQLLCSTKSFNSADIFSPVLGAEVLVMLLHSWPTATA